MPTAQIRCTPQTWNDLTFIIDDKDVIFKDVVIKACGCQTIFGIC